MADQNPPPGGTDPGSDPSGGQPGSSQGDETWSTYSPPVSQPYPETPPAPTGPETLPPTHVPYGNPQPGYSTSYSPQGTTIVVSSGLTRSRRTSGCGLMALVMTILGFVIASAVIVTVVRSLGEGFNELQEGLDETFDSGSETVDMHSAAGFEALVAAVREETGSTTVFDTLLYDEYAVISVPADKSSKRYYSYYFDGDISRTSQGTTDNKRYDLSTIDPGVTTKLLRKARTGLVDDPTSVYLSIRAPKEFDDGAWYHVYASNDFMESGYFTADKTGNTVMESPVQ